MGTIINFLELIKYKENELYNSDSRSHSKKLAKQLVKLLEWKDIFHSIRKEEKAKERAKKRENGKKGEFDLK